MKTIFIKKQAYIGSKSHQKFVKREKTKTFLIIAHTEDIYKKWRGKRLVEKG